MSDRRLVYEMPTPVVFGWGAAADAGDHARRLGGSRALLVTDPGVLAAGLVAPALDSLAGAGMRTDVFDEVEPQPSSQNCLDCAAALARTGADLVVAVGGGSAIDVAKCARALHDNGGEPIDYWRTGRAIAAPSAPLICLPTTAGSGSEVTPFAIVNDRRRNEKLTLADRNLAPQLAIVDPQLHLSCPAAVTAYAGVDALTHAIEAYTSRLANPWTDALALQSIEMCARFLVRAGKDGSDRDARAGMAQAATLAGLAFGQALLGLCHAISGPLGKHLHLSHGLANAVLLPHVLAFNRPAAAAKLRRVAQAFHADDVVAAVTELLVLLKLPVRLRDVGLTEALIPHVARESVDSINFQLNPRAADAKEVEHLLRSAL